MRLFIYYILFFSIIVNISHGRSAQNLFNDLGLQVVQSLQQNDDQNVLISPLGVSRALLLLHQSTNGQTREELSHVIGLDDGSKEDEGKKMLSEEEELLKRLLEKSEDLDQELVILTRMLIRKKGIQSLKETFKRAIKEELNNDVIQLVDFERDAKQVTNAQNQWLYNATRGRQTRFFKDSLDPMDSSVVLLSAADFSGKPLKELKELKEKKQFNNFVTYSSPLIGQLVPYLYSLSEYRLKSSEELKSDLIEIPFKRNVSLILVQPRDFDSLQYLNENSTSAQLSRAFNDLLEVTPIKTKLFLPKLKLEFDFDFKDVFEEVFDLKSLFTSAQFADNFRPTNTTSGQRVSTSVHRAALEIKSSEAPSSEESTSEEVKEFWINKPFLLVLRDNKENAMLLMGKVNHLVDEEALGLGFI